MPCMELRGQLVGSCFPTSTMWLARIELRSSSLVAITFYELNHLTYLSGNKKDANFQGKFYSIVFEILYQSKEPYNDQNIKNNFSKIGCCLLFMILHYWIMWRVKFIFPNESKEDPRLLAQGEGIHQPFLRVEGLELAHVLLGLAVSPSSAPVLHSTSPKNTEVPSQTPEQ